MGNGLRIGAVAGWAAVVVSTSVFGQDANRARLLAEMDQQVWQQSAGWTWPQTHSASKLYKLDSDQKSKLNKLLGDRQQETMRKHSAKSRLTYAVSGIKETGLSFDEEGAKQKAAALQSDLAAYTGETRTLFRNEILTEEQRKTFDEQQAAGNDPLTGEPADDTLPNHDPAKFKAFSDARMKQWQEQAAAWQGSYRAQQMFTGKGFIEAEWTNWLDYVARLTGMDERQRGLAAEFLDMAKSAAADYRKAKEDDYKKIAGELNKIQYDRNFDPGKRAEIQKTAAELSAPVDEIGKRFREDVAALLSDEQKRKLGRR